jgi:hypothetical protein
MDWLNLFFWLRSWFFWILDYWNGTQLDIEKGYLQIYYRYRLAKYVVHVPYSLIQGPQEFVLKGHIIKPKVPYQNGIKVLVDAQALGYDEIRDHFAED